jgi:hypothetical protein
LLANLATAQTGAVYRSNSAIRIAHGVLMGVAYAFLFPLGTCPLADLVSFSHFLSVSFFFCYSSSRFAVLCSVFIILFSFISLLFVL